VFGAIFLQEMLIAGRRRRSYFLRWVYAAVLLVQMVPWLVASLVAESQRAGSSAMSVYVRFFDTFAAQHFFYLFALTPALAAGAITDEKLRGTLDYLLTSCLQPAEIVLGKLLARACQVLAVALVGLPIICFFGVIGDLDLSYAAALVTTSAVLILGVGGLSMLASVWCRRTRDAILCTYLVLVTGYVLLRVISAAGWDWPAEVLSPWQAAAQDREGRWTRVAWFALAWLAASGMWLGLACWRLRPAHADRVVKIARLGRMRKRAQPVPDKANPVLWRERCVHGIAPLVRLRAIPLWLAVPGVALTCAASLGLPIYLQLPEEVDLFGAVQQDGLLGLHEVFRMNGIRGWDVAAVHGGVACFILTLLLAVRASGCITEERENGTWDALLLTPLSTREIVWGKGWGLLASGLPYLLAYAAGSIAVALLIGLDVLLASTLASLTMVVFAPWVTAVGLWSSAFLRSSWRSLLATLGICYGYYMLALPVLAFPSCIISSFVGTAIMLIALAILGPNPGNRAEDVMLFALALSHGLTMLILNAAIVWPGAWALMNWARARVDRTERARVSRSEQEYMQFMPRLERLAEELAEEQDTGRR
jgi:ABC-type transport system involved in multi-copper enzyme maturation permease subunit